MGLRSQKGHESRGSGREFGWRRGWRERQAVLSGAGGDKGGE